MDTTALYNTFTHPKVVTSMLIGGIGLGLALSALLYLFSAAWFLPVAFAAVALGTAIAYMAWLDRQEFRDLETLMVQEPVSGQPPVLIRAEYQPFSADTPSRYALFTDHRVIRSMLLLAISLGLAICVTIVLFHGTWFLSALIAVLTIGAVTGYLCWLDGLKPDGDRGPSSP